MCKKSILLACFILALGLAQGASAADPSLIGWYQLEGDGTDSSNYGNHGTVYGNPAWVNSVGGYGQAIMLDGLDDYVSIGRNLLNDLPAFTLAAWVNVQGTTTGRVGLFGQNDAVEFGFQAGDLHCWTPGGGEARTAWTEQNDEWHHVAAVGSGNNIVLYLDGQAIFTGGGSTANYGTSTFPVNIGGGGVWDASGNWFTGLIDDVHIYNRALSAAEIQPLAQRYDASRSPSATTLRTRFPPTAARLRRRCRAPTCT